MDDAIDAVLDQWLVEGCTTMELAVGRSNSAAQKKKEEAKLKMAHLVEKRKKEATIRSKQSRQESKQVKQVEQSVALTKA